MKNLKILVYTSKVLVNGLSFVTLDVKSIRDCGMAFFFNLLELGFFLKMMLASCNVRGKKMTFVIIFCSFTSNVVAY